MRYKYTATQSDGKTVESEMEASDSAEVLQFIASRGLTPLGIRKVGGWASSRVQLFQGGITLADQIFLSKYLALMLRIGTNLLQAVNILLQDFKKPSVREFLIQVRTNLERGQPFYLAFQRYPKVFSSVYVNLVRAGEASGNLEGTFATLTTSLSKEKELKDQVRGALVYPIILLSASFLILIFLVMFALPRIAKVFTEGGFEAPFFSRIVFSVGLFFGKFGWVFLLGFVLLLVFLFYLYRFSFSFKRFLNGLVSELPVVRDVVRKVALQRFASTFASLIRAGLPITEALDITAEAVGNGELKDALLRVSHEGISKGLTLGEAFKREPFFPQTVVNLIAISERAGHTEEVLGTLADFYTSEITSALKTIMSFLEPFLLLFIGSVVGAIALSVIVPIYQLTSQF